MARRHPFTVPSMRLPLGSACRPRADAIGTDLAVWSIQPLCSPFCPRSPGSAMGREFAREMPTGSRSTRQV